MKRYVFLSVHTYTNAQGLLMILLFCTVKYESYFLNYGPIVNPHNAA